MLFSRLSQSRRYFLAATGLLVPVFLSLVATAQGQSRAEGWLELEELTGEATIQRARASSDAALGNRLEKSGDAFETSSGAQAVFRLDNAIGRLYISEETKFRIEALGVTPQGGRVTQIQVERGQVRLSLRPFKNSDSSFVLNSPASMTKVKGTEFGVTVQPDGQTGVATEDGIVEVSAEGEMVEVNAQQQTFIRFGEPPQPVRPLTNNTELSMEVAELSEDKLRLVGRIDPVNLLTIDGVNQATGASGMFDISLPVRDKTMVLLQVTTPLGTRRTYEIPLFWRGREIAPIPTKALD